MNDAMLDSFKILLICSACLILGCNGKDDITVIANSKELEILKITQIPENCASDLFIIDSLLVMVINCSNEAISVYNKNNHEHAIDFGVKGALPSEFQFPFVYKRVAYNPDSILFYDANLYKNKSVNLTEIVNGGNQYGYIKDSPLNRDLFFNIDLGICNDKIVGVEVVAGVKTGIFFIYDPATREKRYIEYDRYKNHYPNSETLMSAWSCHLFPNGESRTVAASFRFFDMVNFYHDDGRLKKSVKFGKLRVPTKAAAFSGIDYSEPLYSRDIFGTKDYCWVLRCGIPLEDIRTAETVDQTILQFDWEGNLINSYSTSLNIYCIAVDEAKRRIYSVKSTDDPEFAELIEFQF